ncbi:MAG: hypothetical protein H6911_03970 [Rickettsiaceae bacterium]|nr:hypothetical protein [Rickettsiaceae bacterium]
MKRYFLLLVFLSINLVSACCPIPSALNSSILKKAEEFPKSGILKQRKNYVYLALDNQYIHSLYPIIQNFDNKTQKPPYFRKADPIGSHVSVMYEKETEDLNIEDVNKSFNFTLNKLKLVESKGKSYYVLEIESPELEKLRLKYGLTKLLNGFKFPYYRCYKRTTITLVNMGLINLIFFPYNT